MLLCDGRTISAPSALPLVLVKRVLISPARVPVCRMFRNTSHWFSAVGLIRTWNFSSEAIGEPAIETEDSLIMGRLTLVGSTC